MKVIKHLVDSIRASASFNAEAESRPHCIIWTDKDKLWENTIERLKAEMSELLILGEYAPEKLGGPAIWLRVAIAGLIEGYSVPYGKVPVIYLPGISRQDIRAVEQCPDELKPVAELQYRGVIWSQSNARDWTPFAYLKTKKGGLCLNVPQDEQTLSALHRSLPRLLDENVENLAGEYLDKDYFNTIISGGDPIRDILTWMSGPEEFKATRTKEEWMAFIDICKSKYKFHPEQDGVLGAGEKLAGEDDAWNLVWDRFCEAPQKYHGVSTALRNTIMPLGASPDRSPQWNEEQEALLRSKLKVLEGLTEQNARNELLLLENEHGKRREYVWADFGESNLAKSLYWLSILADLTENKIGGSFSTISETFDKWGWKVDDAAVNALLSVSKKDDSEAVIAAIRSVYLPWIDENARTLQKLFRDNGHPDKNLKQSFRENACVFFIDGLRFDLAKNLSEKLKNRGFNTKNTVRWAQLPTVTSTCKPALTSIADQFMGNDDCNEDFEPVLKATGQKLTSQKMNSLMGQVGWSVLKNGDTSKDAASFGWVEYGHVDEDGHNLGWKMISHIEGYTNDIIEKIEELFNAGWKSVKLITDHGWLMMPKGLPKATLAVSLSDSKWGRCVAIKPGALFDGSYYPWYWNENVHFALAEGVSCYRASTEYTHGGISLQECLLLDIEILPAKVDVKNKSIILTDVTWKGLRCKVAVEGEYDGLRLDIRMQPANPGSSIVMNKKEFDSNGIASVVVDDDTKEGASAYLVVIDEHEKTIFQTAVIVGGKH